MTRTPVTPDPIHRISMLESMMLIRAFEENVAALQAEGRAPGTCTSVGQEAAAVGAIRALQADDLILSNHRSVAHLLARGADPGRLLAEILGRADGYCRGKSGSLHVSAKELGVVLTSTIVGGELSLAPGVALAQKMRGRPGLTTVFFGDGAACEGIFHESLNLAATWQLPLLFVCENNEWQAYVHRRETMPGNPIREWAASHQMRAVSVDGNDADAVFAAASLAAETIRATGRPYFLELNTYRLRGHYEPDDQAYVDPAELQAARHAEPIKRLAERLIAEHVLAPGEVAAMEQRVLATLEAALVFAQASPYPDVAELTTHVYA
ncbi:thiamine pyrophosphate-dependent dehydrogenase E1 component subunit alpha [Aquincola sp. S2]|uniref:Thiamine pyrophosphate-dependent dehydrogenase E1 component subunit alpha n=1 Tax=Pseudaquabacterium terrae TaxID=2732868 RepID=A0ABX2EB13_9BURK|nr:thiamine pyrophosphate-dependent dehydrogenase E1 component subunit alpha [Aquabacterium terrae]